VHACVCLCICARIQVFANICVHICVCMKEGRGDEQVRTSLHLMRTHALRSSPVFSLSKLYVVVPSVIFHSLHIAVLKKLFCLSRGWPV